MNNYEDRNPRFNHLVGESSPYLRQHAQNPVDWYPWGSVALQKAREMDRPVFLSIGYSACHWCHVMAHESFENQDIARYLNDNFVSIKVDREERPDIDHVYMEAVQVMTGGGGWPLTVFLMPDERPFYGGTYFPPLRKGGLAGFLEVLRLVKQAYIEKKDDIEQVAGELQSRLRQQVIIVATTEPLVTNLLSQAYRNLATAFDMANGGFSLAPKFPEPLALELVARCYARSRDPEALQFFNLTLSRMARGGIYDQLGGGFHRYSTDEKWQVPHFEKMLYDNALLARLYLIGYQLTGEQFYKYVAIETLDFLLREMKSPEGGFYSALDADSEGVEGAYYVWAKREIQTALKEDLADEFIRYYGVTDGGNFDGRNILHISDIAGQPNLGHMDEARRVLRKKREQRVKPSRDGKIIASWNGMALSAFCEAAAALGNDVYLEAAMDCGKFIVDKLMPGGRLMHVYTNGITGVDGFLDDHAQIMQGMLDLYAVTFSNGWLELALQLAEKIMNSFYDSKEQTFYDTNQNGENLFVRPRNISDGVVPSGLSAVTRVLLMLAAVTGDTRYEEVAVGILRSLKHLLVDHPRTFANLASALDFYLSGKTEIAVIGNRDAAETGGILQSVYGRFIPGRILAGYDPRNKVNTHSMPILLGRNRIDEKTTVYICHNNTCCAPVTGIDNLETTLHTLFR